MEQVRNLLGELRVIYHIDTMFVRFKLWHFCNWKVELNAIQKYVILHNILRHKM